MKQKNYFSRNEHILVCLSSSPSNAKVVKNAAQIANALQCSFTALYVRTPAFDNIKDSDRQRLEYHINLAQQHGANVVTVYGDDIPGQIAEYARLSGATKIVTGRGTAVKKHFWSAPALTEQLMITAPDVDILIVPDRQTYSDYTEKALSLPGRLIPSAVDIAKVFLILIASTATGIAFQRFNFTESNIITVYILGVLISSLVTQSHTCSVIASLCSVLLFNFFFTEPRLTLHAYAAGYPFTFAIMLIASLITGTLATRLQDNARQSTQAAFRTQILLETNQMLQKAESDTDVLKITANQLMKLLERDVIAYPYSKNRLSEGIYSFTSPGKKNPFGYFTEENGAMHAMKTGRRTGAGTETMQDLKGLYLAIKTDENIYGVIGIYINNNPMDSFESSVVLSILGECALALDNRNNTREKEEAAVMAKNEQLRANLLSTISHDLRTPLTSISGNASNLISNYQRMDDITRKHVFTDIYDDSMWLINIVENLLSVTKIEEGRMNLNLSSELLDEVISEAITHISRSRPDRKISVNIKDELLIAKIDVSLITQVIINLLDNALKYTPSSCDITVTARRKDNRAVISVADTGPGIEDKDKIHVFEKFYTGNKKIADSRRSMGLGLSLCKSIINIHGGEISLSDNTPHGCIFSFTLPLNEVELHE